MKDLLKFSLTVFLLFLFIFINAQENYKIMERVRKSNPIFDRVLPGVEIYLEKTQQIDDSLKITEKIGLYLFNEYYYPWQFNDLIKKTNSKEYISEEDLIKSFIYIYQASIITPWIRWDTLNPEIIRVIKEVNFSSIDSAMYNYKASFDFGQYKNKMFIINVEDKEILMIEEMYPNGKTTNKCILKLSSVIDTKSSVIFTDLKYNPIFPTIVVSHVCRA
jgi:hypothetical protein